MFPWNEVEDDDGAFAREPAYILLHHVHDEARKRLAESPRGLAFEDAWFFYWGSTRDPRKETDIKFEGPKKRFRKMPPAVDLAITGEAELTLTTTTYSAISKLPDRTTVMIYKVRNGNWTAQTQELLDKVSVTLLAMR